MAARIRFAIVLFIFAAVAPVYGIQFAPVVTTTSGPVRGVTVQTVHRYTGIPFAKAERFKPPGSPTPWTATKDVFTYGKVCPQIPFGFKVDDMSEDCLNLNVFVPNNTDMNSATLPVMVWVYGGGFTSGNNRFYDGSLITALGEVIVVVINYRVGVFGFLATGKEGLKGNYGMLDQVEGLKWVKNNIKRFGGDPGKVTIFGESAGGASVGLLMLSPLASGLYHNAIPQSGSGPTMWATADYMHAQKIARWEYDAISLPESLLFPTFGALAADKPEVPKSGTCFALLSKTTIIQENQIRLSIALLPELSMKRGGPGNKIGIQSICVNFFTAK